MDAFIIGRIVERLTVVITGAACIYWGFRLFTLGISSRQDADFSKAGWKISLKGVGPGVFFSLFGAAIVFGSWISPLKFTNHEESLQMAATQQAAPPIAHPATAVQTISDSTVRYAGPNETDPKDVYALNTAIKLANENDEGVRVGLLLDLQKARPSLEMLKMKIVIDQFGKEAVEKWQALHDKFELDPKSVDLPDRNLLTKIQPWMTRSFADE